MKQRARETLARLASTKSRVLTVLLITIYTISILASSVSSTSSLTPKSPASNQQATNQSATARDTQSARSSNTGDVKTQKQATTEQQHEQSTDISSMYVQIPIAEPPSDSEGTHRQSGDSAQAETAAATSWTGPWPKKFQIGYIKQSDLHQVLMESLKGDPFVSIGSHAKSAPTIAPTSTPSPNSAKTSDSAQAKQWPQYQQQLQRPAMGANNNKNAHINQRDLTPKGLLMQNRYPLPQTHPQHQHQLMNFQRPFNNLHPNQKLIPMNNNFHPQNQQFQFAGFASSMLKNQPVYTINNFPAAGAHQQELADINQLLHNQHQPNQFQAHSAHNARPQKSSEYLSSWRPVTSDNNGEQAITGVAAKPAISDYQSINDGFDEPILKEGQPMNRHPMLNSYLDSDNAAPVQQQQVLETPATAKMSPAMISAMKMKEQNKPDKSTKTASGTKTKSPEASSGTKSTRSSGDSLSGSARRSNSTTTTTASTTATGSTTTEGSTTVSSGLESNSTATSPSTTTTAATTTLSDNETTEPDAEAVDADADSTTEPENTTLSSTTPASITQQSNSTTKSTTSAPAPDSDEVVTQNSVAGQSNISFGGNDSESTTPRTTTTTGSSREETTPRNEARESMSSTTSTSAPVEAKGGEVEGTQKSKLDSMSDEALLAAAVQTASDIGKTGGPAMSLSRQRAQPAVKKTRSSERLVKPKQTESTTKKPTSKLITKKVPQTSSRSAKQVGATKSQSQKASASLSKKRSSEKPKKTRMAAQSERLQQVVSMTAAQAQSTAQTLASLLLSRCMSSASCSHLLDICTTKQAMVPISGQEGADSAGNWSMPIGLVSSSVMSLASALQADKALKLFPQWRDAIENLVDIQDSATSPGYTLILPSNEAIDRLTAAQVDHLQTNLEPLGRIIENHLLESAESVDFGSANSPKTKVIRSKGLQVNQHRDKMVTINGKRLIYANQAAPANGRIHVIDGLLDWQLPSGAGANKLLDIMDTLKQCDKFDGFVTLAEGTGLFQILKQDGPMTVFVPSNEALRKIPDEELDVIKNNNTALKEFLMYHVVNGSYFSQDLRDGQQLTTILDMKPIQVGVRVDGCSRRLVEANTSPMRRPDIVAKNGVIHILDWYLTVRDNDWCDGSISSPSQSAPASSERLQQVATDSGVSYATRMPANHKPLNEASAATQAINQKGSSAASAIPVSSSSSSSLQQPNTLETNNIIITATALTEPARAA